jgi:hypothetical protein
VVEHDDPDLLFIDDELPDSLAQDSVVHAERHREHKLALGTSRDPTESTSGSSVICQPSAVSARMTAAW